MNGNVHPSVWPSGPEEMRALRSLDGGVQARCAVLKPDRYGFFNPSAEGGFAVPRGAGLSFAAASFGKDVKSIELGSFDRVLGFDSATGQVEVEAGISLGALFRFLSPRGRYLPVQPGFGAITVGGCIACDVHGKNPAKDGTFIAHVQSLRLFHPDHGTIRLSDGEDPELFRATCGGFGLTGIIVSATLRTRQLTGWATETTVHRVADGNEAAMLLQRITATSDLAYGWLDCAAPYAASFGRGLVFETRIVAGGLAELELPAGRLSAAYGSKLPFCLMNRVTMRAINAAYGYRSRRTSGRSERGVAKALFPFHGNEQYFRLFGRKGFLEYQAIVPNNRVVEYLRIVRELGARYGVCFTLAVERVFTGRNDLLRFDGEGIGVAFELPRQGRAREFMGEMDKLVIESDSRPNIYKDSRIPRAVVEATYPQCDKFRAIRLAWDPRRRFRSEVSTRLGL
jgi:decaprenylphospho-beta-D-ribofuranose 2-oxidase